MGDPLPQLTTFLGDLLLYLIYLGIILAVISAVIAGILLLPIFGLSERNTALGTNALRWAVIGLLVILLAIPIRNILLHYFPPPTGTPTIPFVTPTPGRTPTRTP